MARTCLSIVLAAGEGTRMRSARAKVLHEVAGLAMVRHVVRAAKGAGADRLALVVGRDAETVVAEAGAEGEVEAFEQTERLGTAHAVLAAREAIAAGADDVLLLFGDTPLIRAETLTRVRAILNGQAEICVVGFRPGDPSGYGRLLEEGGELVAIREERDASAGEKLVGFCNAGLMGLSGEHALALLEEIGNDNAKGEYYLTDVVEIARRAGHRVRAIEADADEVAGVNNRAELARLEAVWQARRRVRALDEGATLIDPGSVHFAHDTALGTDVLIEPNVIFGPGVTVGDGAVIRGFSHLAGANVGPGAEIGPFARLRPGTTLGAKAKVGNFCEVKNAEVADGAKINHLSYVGDARIGAAANVGAGTITCNYDGANKHLTVIGANSFVGSNSALVAPVTVGEGAYVGTGSVVTEDVPDGALAIARGRQVNKEDRGRQIMERNRAAKAEARRAKAEEAKDGNGAS